ncbi:MAG: hypothetical protein R2762_27695 [Bryobacteraceae bacterium]
MAQREHGDAEQAARDEFANLNYLFLANRAGLVFAPEFTRLSGVAVSAIGESCAGLDAVPPTYRRPDAINVYYTLSGATHQACPLPTFSSPAVFLGRRRTLDVLAHEMAHLFGLREELENTAARAAPVCDRNIQSQTTGRLRRYLTPEQIFRMYFHEHSAIHWGRKGPAPRPCPAIVAPPRPRPTPMAGVREALADRYDCIAATRPLGFPGLALASTRQQFVDRYAARY